MTPVPRLAPTLTELRAIERLYRRPRSLPPTIQSRRPVSPTGAWIDAVETPFESVPDTHARLRDVAETFRTHGDRRSVFLTVYVRMTAAVEAGLDAGVFADRAWTGRTLTDFANRYRRALLDYERNDRKQVPRPWRVAFDATLGGTTVVLQDALLGVNAHIDYDLTHTLEQVSIDPNRTGKHRDYRRINDILARLIDAVQTSLVQVYDADTVETLDPLLGPVDERLAFFALRSGRAFAWDNAELVADRRWPFVREYVDWRIETVSTGIAYAILAPTLDRTIPAQAVRSERREDLLEDVLAAFERHAPAAEPSTWTDPG